MAAVRRGEYTDYDETGLRILGKKLMTDIRKEKSAPKKGGGEAVSLPRRAQPEESMEAFHIRSAQIRPLYRG
jgi:hypothetical protein